MKVLTTTLALVAAATMFGAAAYAETSESSPTSVVVYGIPIQVNHVGPGPGSPKHAPFVYLNSSNIAPPSGMYFHKTTYEVPVHQGPGIGSTKLPFLPYVNLY